MMSSCSPSVLLTGSRLLSAIESEPHSRIRKSSYRLANREMEPPTHLLKGKSKASGSDGTRAGRLLGCPLCQNPLQRAAVHVEASCCFGDITAAQFVDTLDMLPPHPVSRHRICGRFGLVAVESQERSRDVIRI